MGGKITSTLNKYKKIPVFLLFSVISFSNTIDLETILNSKEVYINDNKTYKIKKDQEDARSLYYLLDDYNGVEVTANYKKITKDEEDAKSLKSVKVSFGPVYLETEANSESFFNENTNYAVGIEKNIKDVIYSKNDSKRKKSKYKNEKIDLEYSKRENGSVEKIEKKIEIINLYRDIRNKQLDISLMGKKLNQILNKKAEQEKMYKLGNISQIDLESMEHEVKILKVNLGILNSEEKIMKDKAKNLIGIDFSGVTFLDIEDKKIDIDDFMKNYGLKDLKKLELDLKIADEEYSYSVYNDYMPDVTVGYEKNIKKNSGKNEDVFKVKFSKKFFRYDLDAAVDRGELELAKIDLEDGIDSINVKKLEFVNSYKEMLNRHQLVVDKAKLENKKYKIKEKEYNLGKISNTDFMEAKNTNLESQIELLKSKNKLNAYIYELIIRSGV